MHSLKNILVISVMTFLVSISWLAQAAPTATITVDAKRTIGKVQPLVFGHNVEAADSFGIFSETHGFSAVNAEGLWDSKKNQLVPEMVAMSKEIGVKMMRYPGGCLAHNFNWHDAVGPIAERPHFLFGIDEFIAYCRAVGAEPLMTVSDYFGTPQDAADLVEYCNAPADAQHPWAQKRAQWGHQQPFGVRYFELGNESDHGNHFVVPHKIYTAEAYAQWATTTARVMRQVDPTIKLGTVSGNADWNATVLKATGNFIDFYIVHTYPGSIATVDDTSLQGCMAVVDQMEASLEKNRKTIKEYTGRNIPMAITEYNIGLTQDKPIPYRFSFGAALFCGDYIRVLLKPETNVLMANYWHLANGFWGMIRGDAPTYKKLPAYYVYRLWAQHFGTSLVATTTNSPRFVATQPAATTPKAASSNDNLMTPQKFLPQKGSGYTSELRADGTLVLTLQNCTVTDYPGIATLTAPKVGDGYTLSFEARATGSVKTATVGLELLDSRGWDATKSGKAIDGIEQATEWKKYEAKFRTYADCPGTVVAWRLMSNKNNPVSGTIEVRNLKVSAYTIDHFPAYNVITSSASMSADGKTLYLIIFNKHLTDNIPVRISLNGLKGIDAVRRWMVTGPSLAATNLNKEEVREVESGVAMPLPQHGVLNYTAPVRSMTGIEVHMK
ncbi:MAG TPA: alpha-L-arabinofuranosidase C-terminal domain-containing protein [Armatimonadota bacterium]|nr:alpha-L-arabinofuranosidase C-terminal domain-containing protein [Armatimonadota bacterium]